MIKLQIRNKDNSKEKSKNNRGDRGSFFRKMKFSPYQQNANLSLLFYYY